jgi:hypothetical protein
MKSFYTLLISLALIFSACSTSYYSSTPYEDDIYYSSSSSSAPMRNIKIQDEDVQYNTPKYSEKQYNNQVTETDYDNKQESLSKEKATLKYSGEYKEVDSTGYKVIKIEKEIEEPEYSINVINIDNPYRFYNDPFYSSRFSFGYNWGWGYPYYNSSFYYGLGWDWGFGNLFWDPFWPNNYYYHNYYNPYHWNYGYNTGYVNYYRGFAKTVNYGHRNNRGHNIISKNQLSRSQRNLSSTLRKSQPISSSRLNSRSERSSSERTILDDRRILYQKYRDTHSRSVINNLKQGSNLRKSNESTFNNNRSVFSETISNTRSNNSASKRYSKPKSYTNPQNRRQNASNEYFRPRNKSISTGTVRKVVNTTSRSRRSSSTINNSGNHNYSTSVRTRSISNSRSSSTISRSSRSSRSSGNRSAGSSIISRSSGSSSSSGNRSASGSSSGSRSNRSKR